MQNLKAITSSKSVDWETPPELFEKLNTKYKFNLDPCCTIETAKCSKYFTIKEDGLKKDWSGYRVFCNPPYGTVIGQWIEKAFLSKAFIVMLLPARTDTKWFHDYIYNNPKTEILFLKGRIKFLKNKKPLDSALFPSMIVIFNNN